jgi:hypothetical protein
LSEAEDALERGDFARARQLARGTAEEKEIFRRTGPDPLIIKIAIGCVGLFALVIAVFHGP